jgi:hypothetical protein
MLVDMIFRLATPDDDNRLLELLNLSFNRSFSPEWFKWFNYFSPTGLNRTAIAEETETGKMAGSYSLLPINLRLNGKIIKASLCTMVNTLTEYQGQGLFTKLGRYALGREVEFGSMISLGMPNKNAYRGHMKVGWDVMCHLPFLVKHNCKIQKHNCREIERFDSRLDKFNEKISNNYAFIVLKDSNFMNWRLVDRPDKQYTKFIYEEGQSLKGYIVLKHFDDQGYHKVHILDVQAESIDILNELTKAAESFAHNSNELNMWTNPHNPYHHEFIKNGFYERESTDLLIIHFNNGKREPIQDGAWWFCLADNDVY